MHAIFRPLPLMIPRRSLAFHINCNLIRWKRVKLIYQAKYTKQWSSKVQKSMAFLKNTSNNWKVFLTMDIQGIWVTLCPILAKMTIKTMQPWLCFLTDFCWHIFFFFKRDVHAKLESSTDKNLQKNDQNNGPLCVHTSTKREEKILAHGYICELEEDVTLLGVTYQGK